MNTPPPSRLTRRFARLAIVPGLALALSVTLFANAISVTGYTTDGSEAGQPQILLYADTEQYPALETVFTEVYPFIDGHPIQIDENDAWHSMKMIYDVGYNQYWTITVSTTAGWHSVQYLAHTQDGRWVWDRSADWIYIGG